MFCLIERLHDRDIKFKNAPEQIIFHTQRKMPQSW